MNSGLNSAKANGNNKKLIECKHALGNNHLSIDNRTQLIPIKTDIVLPSVNGVCFRSLLLMVLIF